MSVLFRYQSIILLQLAAACATVTSTAAQQPELPSLPAPPPMHLVSKSERSQLDEARDPKARLHETMTLAESHLTRAEKLTDDKKFDEALTELGDYLGVIGDLRDYCSKLDANKNSTRDLYRHFEWQVRTHIPRLAVIQRATPAAYAPNVKAAEEFIKDTRAEALDSFYGHSVLREPPPEGAAPPASSGGAKDAAQTKHP
jgi:hypothetical protein